jgi:glycogen operon protein
MVHTTIPPTVNPGRSSPLGATILDGGANFSVFSRHATAIELLFFDTEDDARPSCVIPLYPTTSRSYHYWHAFVPEIRPGQLSGYRVHGRFDPDSGMRFDPSKVMIDFGRVGPRHPAKPLETQDNWPL